MSCLLHILDEHRVSAVHDSVLSSNKFVERVEAVEQAAEAARLG